MLDGEAVVLGVDGISDFNALHSRKHDQEVQLFDLLAMDGDAPPRPAAASAQDQSGAAAGRRWEGITVAPFDRGEIGLIHSAPHAE
ncbi:hypothetical protein [Bradyrhizobium zhanjiangense]|uniref:hypothetical protein n=1 Tax=Bradyrhizobium zhanjiangense TaxID=1325107 RepID=UPI001FE1CD04|nr:hypothetical protein [Bradyrhizobium zhanjiangense]